MIAELLEEAYDAEGRRIFKLHKRHRIRPTFPMGRYMSQPVRLHAKSIDDIRAFLRDCRYVSDEEPFGRDYWIPPEDFEIRKRGDCDDFAVWTWRQLVDMGKAARCSASPEPTCGGTLTCR